LLQQGYPTIKYYKDGEEHDYSGGRGYDDLSEFVKQDLEVKCDIEKTEDTCSAKAQKYVIKWKGKEPSDVASEIQRLSTMMGKTMKVELKAWVNERTHILTQLAQSGENEL